MTGNDDLWERQFALFDRALEVPIEERGAFLDRECEDDEMRVVVGKLLAAHESSGPLDEAPTLGLLRTSDQRGAMPATAEREHELAPGTLLVERFEILGKLGQGGMGSVYEAWDRELDSKVALKTVRPEIAASSSAAQRFSREIQLARQVTHPNVCRIFDVFQHRGLRFLTMELLEGITLDEFIEREGPIAPEDALPLVEQVCAALGAAHGVGVVHRDLKPANIMVVDEGAVPRVVVTDFGLARSLGGESLVEQQLTATGQVIGTPVYMAPEQLEGGQIVPETDLYALGAVVFEMLTGRRAFEGETPFSIIAEKLSDEIPSPREYLPALDIRWENAVLRCLERRPEDRFSSAAEFASTLRGESRSLPPRRHRRRRRLMGLGAVVLVLAIVGVLWSQWPNASRQASGSPPTEPLWVLMSPLENKTGDDRLDGVVEEAMRRELSNSGVVRVVPRSRVQDTLRLMGWNAEVRLDAEAAREVALRDGGVSALVAGSLQAMEGGYLLAADVVGVADGGLIAGVVEEATVEGDLLAAVRRLSDGVRDALGETQADIQTTAQKLERVSTPSLEALRLYTRADELIQIDRPVAIELLNEALDIDPSFAMAHLLLAHALRNEGVDPEEYRSRAQRAFELSDQVPDREKFFIRGSYHSMHGRFDQAISSYATLIRLHPDHQWAGNNLFNTLTALGRMDDAVDYAVLEADNRPNSFQSQAKAALALSSWADRPDDARPYLERARLLREELEFTDPYWSAWLDTLPVFEAWQHSDSEGVTSALAAIEPVDPESLAGWFVGLGHMGVGQAALALEAWASSFSMASDLHRAMIGWINDDPVAVREVLAEREFKRAPPSLRVEPARLLLLVLAGEWDSLESDLEWLHEQGQRTDVDVVPSHVLTIVEGARSFTTGDLEQAVAQLSPALAAERQTGSVLFFLGVDVLARAYERLGQADRALRALQSASAQRHRATPAAVLPWIWIEVRRARALRSAGEDDEATRVEAGLARLLAQAEPGFLGVGSSN